MPIVFVHGVNTRREGKGQYERAVERRDALFRETVVVGQEPIRNPYWGDLAAKFPWDHGGLPESDYETFGRSEGLADDELLPALTLGRLQAFDENTPADAILAWLGRRSFEATTDLLMLTAADPAVAGVDASGLARMAKRIGAYAYAHKDAPPAWVKTVKTDKQFVDHLRNAVDVWDAPQGGDTEWEDFGPAKTAWEWVRGAASRIERAATRTARTAFRRALRDPIHDNIARFLGDVLVYMKTRDEQGDQAPILKVVIADLEAAAAARKDAKEPLIVVAHSMGGNIVYDILTHFRPQLAVDFLVTVGSQVAVLEELKLFKTSDPAIPRRGHERVARPPGLAGKWFNVFDYSDVLGFATSKVFQGSEDFAFDTGAWILGAHGAYFSQPSFYERLRARIAGGGA